MFEKPPTPVRCVNLDLSPFPSPLFPLAHAIQGSFGFNRIRKFVEACRRSFIN